jgi:alpha-glucosidase
MLPWTRDGVVYQVYPRSFQDSNGDGSGDLPGITARLDHLQWLGADAVWLSPIYPSPMADMGYDVSDYQDVDPMYGTLADADALIAAAHERDLKVLFDIVPCHTSIEHRWFREHPDWYVWSDRDGPQNNWRAAFGGPAWSRDERSGRWYLHSFYPEQPDLDFRNPEVREAVGDVLRFWLDRGVDGFRLDAIDRLMKDPQRRDDPPRRVRRCCRCPRTTRSSSTSTAATRPTSATRWRHCAPPRPTRSWWGRCTCRRASCARTSSTSTSRSPSSSSTRTGTAT